MCYEHIVPFVREQSGEAIYGFGVGKSCGEGLCPRIFFKVDICDFMCISQAKDNTSGYGSIKFCTVVQWCIYCWYVSAGSYPNFLIGLVLTRESHWEQVGFPTNKPWWLCNYEQLLGHPSAYRVNTAAALIYVTVGLLPTCAPRVYNLGISKLATLGQRGLVLIKWRGSKYIRPKLRVDVHAGPV